MNLSNIVIVLDHPDESRNIGAACRAMANNDIKNLRIVGNINDYDVEKIHVLAIHAGYIFDNATFYNSIKEATSDCVICAGTTRRRGKKRGKLLLPEEFCDFITENQKTAIVFGNERTGLTDEQLDECNLGVTIPSSEDFGSLNLSHAVQIMCYHLFRKKLEQKNGTQKGYTPVTLDRIDESVQIITDNLKKIGFFKMPGRKDMENFWRSILSRARITQGEAVYLEKIFTKMSGLNEKSKQSGNTEEQ